jgi:hypothetical protein
VSAWACQAREEQEREAQRVREAATGLRDKLVEEMMELSRGLREKEVLERRLGESRRALERLPVLEKELHKAKRDLQVGTTTTTSPASAYSVWCDGWRPGPWGDLAGAGVGHGSGACRDTLIPHTHRTYAHARTRRGG